MSTRAQHESKKSRQLCERCRNRKARFQYRGVVRADRDHTLCFECYRSERERRRAQALAAIETRPLRSPFGRHPAPSEREIAHRRAIVAHLERQLAGGAN